MKVYLSGPIERVKSDDDLGWFYHAQSDLNVSNIEVYNPLTRGVRYLRDKGLGKGLSDLETNTEFLAMKKDPERIGQFAELMKGLVELDLYHIRTSDVMMVHVDPSISGGTAGEMTIAKHLGIKVIGFTTVDPCLNNGWVIACCDLLFHGPNAYKTALQTVIVEQGNCLC